MIFNNDKEVTKFLEDKLKKETWVGLAIDNSTELRALVNGEDFNELLLKIEGIEGTALAIARKKYAKDVRSLWTRLNQPRSNVFTASGKEVINDIKSTTIKDKVTEALFNFKGQKPISKYMSESFFRLRDVDPNGLIFLEYISEEDIYPTYKSITDIHYYESDGQLLDVVIFNPIKRDGFQTWRIVDDLTDWTIRQDGLHFTVIEDLTFQHPFGKPPAIVLSDIQDTGSELRISPLWDVVEDAKDYARDKSILTIYKFQTGMPRHYRFEKGCKACQGTGKTGQGEAAVECNTCGGSGNMRRNDVTDITILDMPREGEPMIAPNPEGFISPDLKTWQQYKDDIKDSEDSMESTMWGTRRLKESSNETATGRFIDVQPVENVLNTFSDSAEWAHNMLTDWVVDWAFGSPQEEHNYHTIYGRGYILETADLLLDRYNKSRESGSNNTVLDKELAEYITAKYQNNMPMMDKMKLKASIEPYVHVSLIDTNLIFGNVEANKKILFPEFWIQVNKDQERDALLKEFDVYFIANNKVKEPEIVEPKAIN